MAATPCVLWEISRQTLILSKEKGLHMPHSIELRIVDEAGNVMETISSKDQDFYGINQRPKIRRMDVYPQDGIVNLNSIWKSISKNKWDRTSADHVQIHLLWLLLYAWKGKRYAASV